MITVNLIAARSKNNIIGNASGIPWFIKGEQSQFKELTTGNVVIMGRKTYEDMGRPLKNRINIVVSSHQRREANLMVVKSLEEALKEAPASLDIYMIGGRRIFEESLSYADRIWLTEIDMIVPEDPSSVYFPEFDTHAFVKYTGPHVIGDICYTRTCYVRKEKADKLRPEGYF